MRSRVWAALLAATMVLAPSGGVEARDVFGLAAPFRVQDLPKSPLRSDLERLSVPARATALRRLHSFSFPASDAGTLRVDRRGDVFYADPPARSFRAHRHQRAEPIDRAQAVVPVDRSRVLKLHSKPGASRTVYLNFRGWTVSGTAWNASSRLATHVMKPYTEDSDFAGLSQNEANTIAEVWLRVAEDYAPFDIDVTTETPPKFGPNVGHVLITPRRDAAGKFIFNQVVGGVAYVGVWGYSNFPAYQPALVFPENLGSAKAIAEAASHELGHNLGLSHDGTASQGYYGGHGSGLVSWGPLMGVGYYTNVTQWSRGEYPGANNPQDDLALIAQRLSYRVDDHGGTADTATPLIVEGQQVVSHTPVTDPMNEQPAFNRGLITSASDVDVFAFKVGTDGEVDLTVTPAWKDAFQASALRSANLDVALALYAKDPAAQAYGALVATSDPSDETVGRITATLPAGRYYLEVRGTGAGDPAVSGYTAYGSVGQYFVSGTLPPGSETTVPLSVQLTGNGSGVVASNPSGIVCGSSCSAELPYKQSVTLTATPADGQQFTGWTGACTGTSPTCTVVLSASKSVTAGFRIIPTMHLVSVSRTGTGVGSVQSTPAGINCGATCSGSFEEGSTVTLTAVPGNQTSFVGWGGACSGTSRTCSVAVGSAQAATATFATTVKAPVVVTKAGLGLGRVQSSPAGIDCGPTCGTQLLLGTEVTLTATPNQGDTFAYWLGSCTGTAPTCTTTVDKALYTTAVFNMASGTVLTVRKAGTMDGTVVSASVGLNCGVLCAAPFPKGAKVVLTATPAPGAVFKGWTGLCTVSGTTCTVRMMNAYEVTATFSRR